MLQLCVTVTVKTHSSMPPELFMPEWMLILSPIREQLVDNPYIFIPATNIWPRRDNLHHMRTMIENGK
jgi:hypothetical protein